MTGPLRNEHGQFLTSGNPAGRLPRQTETAYLNAMMGEVSPEKWGEIVQKALEDAMADNAHVRARAREWLAKYLIGEPSQLHQLLYREERDIRIVVTFGDNGYTKHLPVGDIIEGEATLVNVATEAD